jgi:hypothetical protein
MMRENSLMKEELKNVNLEDIILPKELEAIIASWFVKRNDCFFFRENIQKDLNELIDRMEDKTAVECFINHFHMDMYVSERFLDYACLFCNRVLDKWRKDNLPQKLNVVISTEENNATIRFYVIRDDEIPYLDENLEESIQAVLETTEAIKIVK